MTADLYPQLGFRPAQAGAPEARQNGDGHCIRYVLDLTTGPVPDTPHIRETLLVRP
ncbi:hypothetical protein [Streptomyces sp. NPDC091371]|uniref:hypothetical protein n=1 Tax=Streptomyces sp. NPDC091371 TaxID=3155303 RepID=UPI00343D2BE1